MAEVIILQKPILITGAVRQEFETEAELQAAIPPRTLADISLEQRLYEAARAELAGKELLRDLYQSLKENFNDTQQADVINRTITVINLLAAGFIKPARTIANGLVTAGSLTVQVKTRLVNSIDAAIAANQL